MNETPRNGTLGEVLADDRDVDEPGAERGEPRPAPGHIRAAETACVAHSDAGDAGRVAANVLVLRETDAEQKQGAGEVQHVVGAVERQDVQRRCRG